MLGLMEKDMRLTLARKQTVLIFLAAALVMGILEDSSFMIGYLTMLATILAVGTISYDEFDNGLAFLMTLPFDRKTYVREKYLFSLFMTASAWCVGAALYCGGSLLRHNAAILAAELPVLAAFIPALYLNAAIMIPLRLKYGSEKSSIVLFLIFGIIAILIFGANQLFGGANRLAGAAEALGGVSPAAVLPALAAVSAPAAYASYRWSMRIMEKKEF